MPQPISRRTFFALITASFFVLLLWWLRRLDSSSLVQNFFGIDDDIRQKIQGRFAGLRRHNATLHQQSILFFTFTHYRAEHLLPDSIRQNVITDWTNFLFTSRDLAWGYIG